MHGRRSDSNRDRGRDPSPRQLIFSARAWLQWQFLCHVGPTEVAGFGLSSPHNPLYLEQILLIRQWATPVGVGFDDQAVADLFDDMADRGIPPQRFARIWLHTHPGSSVTPSGTDEETFSRCFGSCDWAVMAILGRTGRTSARLRFSAGPGTSIEIPTTVDWSGWPDLAGEPSLADLIADWRWEYESLVDGRDFHPDGFRLDRDRYGFPDWDPFGPPANSSVHSVSASAAALSSPRSSGDLTHPVVPVPNSGSPLGLELGIPDLDPFDPFTPSSPGAYHAFE